MTTVARLAHGGFGHEGDGAPLLRGNFFDSLFEDGVHVRDGERIAVNKIYFMLAAAPLAFAGFDRDTSGAHLISHRAKERFFAGGLHGVVVDAIIARRSEVAIAGGEGIWIRIVEEIKFQFAGGLADVTLLRKGIDLALQK